ncbi:MAG: acetate uptake transporter, partial [Eubacteriales bacterium]
GQIIAGIMAFKKGDTFCATAFTAYGLFWWSLVFILVSPLKEIAAPDGAAMGFYLLMWAVFTCFMFIGTLKHNRSSQLVFGSLTILFLLLSIGNFTGLPLIITIAGWEGILCGAFAVYGCLAQIVNNEYGKKVMPL